MHQCGVEEQALACLPRLAVAVQIKELPPMEQLQSSPSTRGKWIRCASPIACASSHWLLSLHRQSLQDDPKLN